MRYLGPILTFVGIAIAVIVGIVLIRNTLRGDAPVTRTTDLVAEVTPNTVLRMRMDGPVVANEDRRSVQIDIGPRERTAAYLKTFEDITGQRATYRNNDLAFEELVKALAIAGFSTRNIRFEDDHNGECASGRVYHFDLIEDGLTKRSLWTNSCNQNIGTFGGNASAVIRLFQAQIPDYNDLIKGSDFRPLAS